MIALLIGLAMTITGIDSGDDLLIIVGNIWLGVSVVTANINTRAGKLYQKLGALIVGRR